MRTWLDSPAESRMTTDANKWAQPMGDGTSCLVKESGRNITQAVPGTDNCNASGVVNMYVLDIREVDDQVAVCTAETVSCV